MWRWWRWWRWCIRSSTLNLGNALVGCRSHRRPLGWGGKRVMVQSHRTHVERVKIRTDLILQPNTSGHYPRLRESKRVRTCKSRVPSAKIGKTTVDEAQGISHLHLPTLRPLCLIPALSICIPWVIEDPDFSGVLIGPPTQCHGDVCLAFSEIPP